MNFTLTIELALTTGTRRGEVCGLRWSDIGEQTVTVGRVVILDAGTPYVKEPKTQASCRTIPLTKRLYAVLRAIEKDRRYVAGELGVPFGDLFSPLVSPEPVPDTLGIGPIPQKHADGILPAGEAGVMTAVSIMSGSTGDSPSAGRGAMNLLNSRLLRVRSRFSTASPTASTESEGALPAGSTGRERRLLFTTDAPKL